MRRFCRSTAPTCSTSEREFVELLRMRDEAKPKDARETPQRLIESAKRRLQLWNVTDEQIAELEKTRKATETLTLLSPFRGVVQSVPVDQGKSVKVGDMLVEVADLSVVWVWAEFYENELSMLQVGQKIHRHSKVLSGREVRRHDQPDQSIPRRGETHRQSAHRYSESGFQAASRDVRQRGVGDGHG